VVEVVKNAAVFVEFPVWDGKATAAVSVAHFASFFCSYLVSLDKEYRN
jgi:hypothetical protein